MDFLPTPSPAAQRVRRFVGLTALLCASAAFAASEPSFITGQKKSYAYSWQQEVQQGAEADKEVVEEMGLYENPGLQAYVEAIGQRLVQASNFTGPNAPEIYRNTKFTFRIIDSDVVNAFALPGGYVYVTRGLLAHVDNEAQLAVVLGHEIGHVVARHSSQQARRDQWGQIGVVLGSILGQKVLGEKMPDVGSQILNYGGKATETFLLKYSREAETEADSLGVSYAARTGYAAGESARFFEALDRLAAVEGKNLPTWASTHPDPGDRARRVQQLAASATPPGTQANIGREEFLRHVDGIVLGDDPRQGFAQNGIFYHPTLHFQMPVAPGWKTDNQRSAVIFGEPNSKAMLGLKLAAGASNARDAANQFVQQSKVQVVANGDTNINGLPATVIIGQKNTDKGAVEVWDAFIEMEGRVYSLLGYSAQAEFEQFRPTFESVAAGFSPLRNLQAMDVRPTLLKVVRADRAGPFTSFIPTSLPPAVSAESIAIMNQVALNQAVPAGELLKIPDVAPPAAVANGNPDYQGQNPYQNSNRQDRYRRDRQYPPQAGYPAPRYPEQTAGRADYPPQSYPPSSYPQQSYPQQYPQQSYPPSSYPQSPAPSPNGYPTSPYPSSNYPQTSPGYPQPAYPQSGYPQSSYPQSSAPQFPQPPGSQSRSNQSTQPTWPRN